VCYLITLWYLLTMLLLLFLLAVCYLLLIVICMSRHFQITEQFEETSCQSLVHISVRLMNSYNSTILFKSTRSSYIHGYWLHPHMSTTCLWEYLNVEHTYSSPRQFYVKLKRCSLFYSTLTLQACHTVTIRPLAVTPYRPLADIHKYPTDCL